MKPFQEQTYYELLEIPIQASSDEIRRAYDRAAELYSADSVAMYALENPDLGDELRSRLREAMEILTDEDLRQEYDRIIGVAPRIAPAEVLRRQQEREDEGEDVELPTQLAMAEVMASAEAVDSTHRELRVSYVERGQGANSHSSSSEHSHSTEGARHSPPEQARAPSPRQPPAIDPLMDTQPTRIPVDPPEPRGAPVDPRGLVRNQARLESAQVMASDSAIADAESALAQVAAKVKEAPPRPKALEIPADAEFSGELLRRVRESKGLALASVADRTRIGSRHLENIEADKYSELPVTVYLRGMLQSLARELGLDPIRVSKSYLALAKR